MGQLTAATASISAPSSTRGSSSGGKQMQSASAIIPRFVFSSLLSLVFKVISLLQSFQPLLKLSNLEGPEQRHPEIAECACELGVHPPGPNISHRFGQHPLYISSRFGHRDMLQRRFVGVPIASASFLAKLCGFLGVGMEEAEPPLCGLALQGLPLDVVALQCVNSGFERLRGIGIPFPWRGRRTSTVRLSNASRKAGLLPTLSDRALISL